VALPNREAIFSPYCSSIYEDLPLNYLINYAIISNLDDLRHMELVGFAASGAKVFEGSRQLR
jgi:hypothetical protein